MPISLTDYELSVVMTAARPLALEDRDPFLRDVARALEDCRERDGCKDVVARTCREMQRKYPVAGA